MPYQVNGPLAFPPVDPALDLASPPISCPETGIISSQLGNSYTQIVDLADIDRSRTLLPPGISEDLQSPNHTDQMDLWVQGRTHPAPLSRGRVEDLAISHISLTVRTSHGGALK